MKPSQQQAEEAVRTLLAYAGDDPNREGLLDTPKRVVKAYKEWFGGYDEDPGSILGRTFEESEGYDEIVCLRDIRMESHCEHHMVPFIGKAHVAYLPDKRVVGISKLARTVDMYSKRLQIQEKLCAQVADAIQHELKPLAVAVIIEAQHLCMTTRGVHKPGVSMMTSVTRGLFRDDPRARAEVMDLLLGKR